MAPVFFIRPRAFGLSWSSGPLPFFALAALRLSRGPLLRTPRAGQLVVISDDFEEWSWEPITFSMREVGQEKAEGGKAVAV